MSLLFNSIILWLLINLLIFVYLLFFLFLSWILMYLLSNNNIFLIIIILSWYLVIFHIELNSYLQTIISNLANTDILIFIQDDFNWVNFLLFNHPFYILPLLLLYFLLLLLAILFYAFLLIFKNIFDFLSLRWLLDIDHVIYYLFVLILILILSRSLLIVHRRVVLLGSHLLLRQYMKIIC